MCVMHLLAVWEVSGFNVQSHFLISIPERHTFTCQAVHFFHTENKQVFVIVEDMFVHLYFIHDIGSHLQTVFQFLESRQKDFLNNLQIPEIAGRQIIGNHHNLLWQWLQFIALGTRQFKDIRVLLMGHNAGTCRAIIRQLHETEVLTVEHTSIKSQFGDSSGNTRQSKSYITFHLATPHLGINNIIV